MSFLSFSKYSEEKIYRCVIVLVIFYSVVIRCYYYLQSKFFWQDEAWLFFALHDATFLNVLTQNNNFFQTYPSLFGVMSWVVVENIGISTYLLRLIPFLGSCLYFILLLYASKRIINIKYAMICLAISIFNVILLNYCDEFKQYSLEPDFTLALLLYYLYNPELKKITYNFVLLSIVSILFSVPAPFIVLVILLCYFSNSMNCDNYKNYIEKIVLFLRVNLIQIFVLFVFSIFYYYFCLKNGDANNGNAWESGMIPCDWRKIPSWIVNNLLIILARLMSNTHRILEGLIFLLFSFAGYFLFLKTNNVFSKFLKFLAPVFITSLFHIYSLGNISWGTQGARLSMYILPILILTSGYFVYYTLNNIDYKMLICKIFKYKKNTLNNSEGFRSKRRLVPNILFVILCIYLSIFTILCMNEWHYEKFKTYDVVARFLEKNSRNVLISHSSVWYSLKYYSIYKGCIFNIDKLGNQMTPTSDYPPISNAFTSEFIKIAHQLNKDKKIIVFVQQFSKEKIFRFIDRCGFTIEVLDFGEFLIFICNK